MSRILPTENKKNQEIVPNVIIIPESPDNTNSIDTNFDSDCDLVKESHLKTKTFVSYTPVTRITKN